MRGRFWCKFVFRCGQNLWVIGFMAYQGYGLRGVRLYNDETGGRQVMYISIHDTFALLFLRPDLYNGQGQG